MKNICFYTCTYAMVDLAYLYVFVCVCKKKLDLRFPAADNDSISENGKKEKENSWDGWRKEGTQIYRWTMHTFIWENH